VPKARLRGALLSVQSTFWVTNHPLPYDFAGSQALPTGVPAGGQDVPLEVSMAFNPFAGFAKYKRFWMGAVMILVMITFVLCTGTRGGMDEFLLGKFRFGGTPVASIDGTTYYRQDFDLLLKQRKVANDYMRLYAKILIDEISNRLRNVGEPKDDNAKQAIGQLSFIRELLTNRTKEPKFFETGTKKDELIDFRVWLAEADRLRVRLQPEYLKALIDTELYKNHIAQLALGEGAYNLHFKVLEEVRRNQSEIVNEDFLNKAHENEYRVRIAQLGDAKYQLHTLEARFQKRISPGPGIPADQVRAPLSPNQLWDFYLENRKEFDVALLPIPIVEFANEIPDPEQRKLEDLFEKFKKTNYDPASDQPGFKKPHQIRVQYVSADANAPFFKRITRASEFFAEYPIGSFAPQFPLATVLTFAAGPTMFESLLERDYLAKVSNELRSRLEYMGGSNLLMDPGQATAAYFARKNPVALAAMIGAAMREDGGVAAIPALLAQGARENAPLLDVTRKSAARALTPMFATVIATGAMPAGLASCVQLDILSEYPTRNSELSRPLPLAIVRSEILKDFDERFGYKLVNANMSFFKKKLDEEHVIGKAPQVQRLLERYGPRKPGAPAVEGGFRDLGLEIAQTEKLYDRYTIKEAPELRPLLESYERYYTTINQIEGRESRPESVLKDDDFWKMFFDGTESFSISGVKYHAKPWPPVIKLGTPTELQANKAGLELGAANFADLVRKAENREPNKDVTFDLFATSNRPFLFWKTDEKLADIPESLAEVKDRVALAWKVQQARENVVLPYIKKIADSLLQGNADYVSILKQEPKFGQKMITFDHLAPVYFERQHFGGPGIYTEFKLRRGAIRYPREDMESQLLAINDVEKLPVKAGIPDLDKFNADLYEDAKARKLPSDKFVQVLTNKPRDTYYLTVVQFERGASAFEFYFTVLPGAARFQDQLFDRAQLKIGANHFKELVLQLRENHRVKEFEEGAKMFENEGGQ